MAIENILSIPKAKSVCLESKIDLPWIEFCRISRINNIIKQKAPYIGKY